MPSPISPNPGRQRPSEGDGQTPRSESADRADSLTSLLAALRPPFDFLARNPQAVARTSVPAASLAERCKDLAGNTDDRTRRILESLSELLLSYDDASATDRLHRAKRCLSIADQLEAQLESVQIGTSQSAEPTANRRPPPYHASQGDIVVMLEQLNKPAQFLRGVGPRRAEMLRKFGLMTIGDLLYHLPFRYEDRRRVRKVAELQIGETASVIGEITHIAERTVGKRGRHILEAVLRDDSGLLALTWYHQLSYFRKRFHIGQRCLVHGKVERVSAGTKRIVHPEIDLEPDEGGQGILPVYNKPMPISVGAMRKLVQQAAQDYGEQVPSVLPPSVADAARVSDLTTALRALHLPPPDSDLCALEEFTSDAHRSLAFDEIFYLSLGMVLRHRSMRREDGLELRRTGALTGRLAASLPFELTHAQRQVIDEICADMATPHPMHRLLQGDVGSGKTIVALYAALTAIENGYQAAFMAPTELLAEQHYRTVEPLISNLGVSAVLLTGEAKRAERRKAHDGIADGSIQLSIGTHALIQEGVRFRALGIGVIDEQHRFGVLQRAALRAAAGDVQTPDMLLMTATPIPRTLALTLYGDLDISIVDELPPNRKPVRTLLINEAERTRLYQLVKDALEHGHQGYVVYPLVESSEKEDLRDATTMATELGRTVFREYRVGLVHGRMKSDEKDAVMRRFRDGDLQLLVSTTVIEVGVDVPNATIMVVEHADRFGLSQLHQLRGRVGRGGDQATCILVAPHHCGEDVYRRLKALASTSDGFKIAEIDLQLRGPGDFIGTRQSGLPDFRVANLIRDSRLLAEARRLAEEWLERNPRMDSPEGLRVRTVLQHRWAGRLGLAEIG